MRCIFSLLVLLLITSCGAKKKRIETTVKRANAVAAAHKTRTGKTTEIPKPSASIPTKTVALTKVDAVINTALNFKGVPYKFGGTSKKGMDCSGLLYVAFKEHDVKLPRTSIQMSQLGARIKVKNLQKGDLLFFKTIRGAKRVNHVGMVVSCTHNEVKFIHASTSKGVVIASLRDDYWNRAFVKANRIL